MTMWSLESRCGGSWGGSGIARVEARGGVNKDVWKEAVDSALTSPDNQSPRLDVYEKNRVNKWRGSMWLALISTSSLNQALLSLSASQYDIDDSGRDRGPLHRWKERHSFTCIAFNRQTVRKAKLRQHTHHKHFLVGSVKGKLHPWVLNGSGCWCK